MNDQSIRRDFVATDFEATRALITWNALVEPGDRIAWQLISEFGPIRALEEFRIRRDLGLEYLNAYERWHPRFSENLANQSIARARKHDLKLLLPSDTLWPKALENLGRHAPLLLWYRGNVSKFENFMKSVGVVGSRNSTHYGQRVTSDVVSVLVDEGAAVVSGGALGIDSVAHRVALGLKGVTMAFMAGSLDLPYPSGNLGLFEEISHHGLLLSEMAPGSNPTRWRFLQRNRLIAAVSSAVVVTEAGLRSGSINTANHAGELGRPVFAIPGPISSPSSAGCNRLIRDQQANLLLEAGDLPLELNWRAQDLEPEASLGVLELRALDALLKQLQSFEKVLAGSGLSESELRIALGSLRLMGLVESGSNATWRRK